MTDSVSDIARNYSPVIPAMDSMYYVAFLSSFSDFVNPLLPSFTPSCFNITIEPYFSMKSNFDTIWMSADLSNPMTVMKLSYVDFEEQLNFLECAIICGLGAHFCSVSTDLSKSYMMKGETLFNFLLGNNKVTKETVSLIFYYFI